MIALAFALMLSSVPQAQDAPVPPACVGPTFVSWEACADAAPEGSPAHAIAMINLGTQAYVQGDYGAALDFYDKAAAGMEGGQQLVSDVFFHTFRGDTYRHAGRMDAARADAAIAWAYLDGRPPAGTDPRDLRPINDEVRSIVLAAILPILKDGDPAFDRARAMFEALPAEDWLSLTRRANTLTSLGEYAGAVSSSKRALDLQPDEPMLRNNHCYTLVEAGRAAEGLPYCEQAVAAIPDAAPVRHSYAAALAGLGRCADAERQLAEARRLEPSSALYREAMTCTPKG
jgi:tetratricopeptide (TPR) repeat protein